MTSWKELKAMSLRELLLAVAMIVLVWVFWVCQPVTVGINGGVSMTPTYNSGEWVLVVRWLPASVGDVVYANPIENGENEFVVKRLVAKRPDMLLGADHDSENVFPIHERYYWGRVFPNRAKVD